MKTDLELKKDILAELAYEPSVKVTDIGVLVKDGVVTLNGYATSYGEKCNAESAAKRVAGVKAIADDIEVKLPDSQRQTDGDIAAMAASQIKAFVMIPEGAVKITVRDGWIMLEGEVEWKYQQDYAENAVQHLTGVKGVTNLVTIKPSLAPAGIQLAITSAFERSAVLDAKNIKVETIGNKAVLRGKVRSYAEREEAERAAWAAPGVVAVDNQIKVKWFGSGEE